MGKLRVGIIGTGGISHCHMNGYKNNLDKVEVVAACDLDEKKLQAYKEQYGIPNVYTDYNEMLAKENLDAVSVCTWNAEHKNATIAALKAGANVICEKPMAMNTEEAEEMLKVAKETGKMLMVGFVRRYGRDAVAVKDFIDNGNMGDIYYAKAQYLRRRGCPGGWFSDKEYSGGGPLIDLGVHVIDLVRYMSNCPKPVSAYGATFSGLESDALDDGAWLSTSTENKFKQNVEDFATGMVRFDNGLVLQVEASFNLNLKSGLGSVELFGTKAGATIDPGVEYFTELNGKLVNIEPASNLKSDIHEMFVNEMTHFVDCCVNGTPCKSPAEDGVVLMRIIDALYESAKLGKEVLINY